MKFREIVQEMKTGAFDELREENENYFEAVIMKGEIDKFVARLEKFFGSPAWPSKEKMTPKMKNEIKEFGGIIPGQTLYFSEQDNEVVFAMLWPWKDGQRTTIKIVKK